MAREFESLRRQHEEDLKLTEQDATESVAIYKQIIEQQKEEMTKFADFVRTQTENMKLLQEKNTQ